MGGSVENPLAVASGYARLKSWARESAGARGSLRNQLVAAGAGSAGLKILSMVLTSVVAIVLARVLQPDGYGVYSFAFAVVTMLGVPVQIGLPTLVMREVARYQVEERWGSLRGLLRWGNQAVVITSLITIGGAVLLGMVLADSHPTQQRTTFAWSLLLLPLLGLGALRSSALRGLGRIVLGQVPDLALRPASLLILVGSFLYLSGRGALDPASSMGLTVVAALVAFIAGTIFLFREIPIQIRQVEAVYHSRVWLSSVLPLSLLGGIQIISSQTDILMLGIFRTSDEVGIYRVAVQLATFVMVAGTVVNAAIAPHMARLHAQADTERLYRLAQRGSSILFGAALVLSLVLIAFGGILLEEVFGVAYRQGHLPLAILCISAVVSAEQGSLVTVMNMTGNERSTARVMAVGASVNVLLNLAAVPLLGMTGAAMGTAISTFVWRALLVQRLRSILGIRIGAMRQIISFFTSVRH